MVSDAGRVVGTVLGVRFAARPNFDEKRSASFIELDDSNRLACVRSGTEDDDVAAVHGSVWRRKQPWPPALGKCSERCAERTGTRVGLRLPSTRDEATVAPQLECGLNDSSTSRVVRGAAIEAKRRISRALADTCLSSARPNVVPADCDRFHGPSRRRPALARRLPRRPSRLVSAYQL